MTTPLPPANTEAVPSLREAARMPRHDKVAAALAWASTLRAAMSHKDSKTKKKVAVAQDAVAAGVATPARPAASAPGAGQVAAPHPKSAMGALGNEAMQVHARASTSASAGVQGQILGESGRGLPSTESLDGTASADSVRSIPDAHVAQGKAAPGSEQTPVQGAVQGSGLSQVAVSAQEEGQHTQAKASGRAGLSRNAISTPGPNGSHDAGSRAAAGALTASSSGVAAGPMARGETVRAGASSGTAPLHAVAQGTHGFGSRKTADATANAPSHTSASGFAAASPQSSSALDNRTVAGSANATPGANAADAGAGGGALNSQAVQIMNAQMRTLHHAGGGQATIQLDPPSLGQVHIQLQVQGQNQARLHFSAAQPATAQALQASLPQLTAALHQNGIHVMHSEVTATATDGGLSGQSGHQSQQGQPGQQGPGNEALNARATHAERRSQAPTSDGSRAGVRAYA